MTQPVIIVQNKILLGEIEAKQMMNNLGRNARDLEPIRRKFKGQNVYTFQDLVDYAQSLPHAGK